MYEWSHFKTLVPLILGAAGLIAFVVYERFVATEPLIRLAVFGNRTAAVTYLGTFFHGIIVSKAAGQRLVRRSCGKSLTRTSSGRFCTTYRYTMKV